MDKLEIRILLKHYWKQNFRAIDAAKKICEVEGDNSVSIRTVQKWFEKFNKGDMGLNDYPRSGRPTTVDSEAILKAVEMNPSSSTRRLSAETGASQPSVVRHLHQHNKRYKSVSEVPHDLTPSQAERRLSICRQLLNNPNDERFIRRIVTCDEKWIYFYNPNRRYQWLEPGQKPKAVPKQDRFGKKIMLCVWWNFEGIIHFEVLPEGQTITAELYSAQLDRMYQQLAIKYPALVNRKRVLLQQDNARPHTARVTQNKITQLEGIEILPHPAFSPDLAPSDYHLFRSMAHFLRGRQFENIEQVENGCREFFLSKDKAWYQSGIEQLAHRWITTVEHNGLYFSE